MSEWQPVTTAPEGKYILLWSGTWRHPFVGRVSPTPYMAYIDVPETTAYEIEVCAMYWMPLPDPPESSQTNKV